ncbi:LSU ribosomal protein L23p (L23Ae) [Methylophaga frappieri]|jgi:large subunit ribosomal protein L23|uniref:Large ribosomal subunit protein uL23 n=1 Tax=Methylophaga frappieri (strain ATCC BAA-2434 / DSM 25690 / JAM7) TaxID=754477 RepID=I1YKT6_METFJ|nr:50S ribosomal protein L23 [Methylophaga frappieri]AFJ03529.1 LSU ribosomal protein L23p (L23Ae) [Methylophaga frappieri]
MNSERLSKIILGPVVAEKATRVAENDNQVVLKVLPNANKTEIKYAVERLFDVKVAAVNTSQVKGKVKRAGRHLGKRADWKKAYVTLADGADLNFLGE